LKGHGFSRAADAEESIGHYMLRKNSTLARFVTGHDFSRADKANKMKRALAPEGMPVSIH
jgi:hypothetical protein